MSRHPGLLREALMQVGAMLFRRRPQSGLRPFAPYRDFRSVVELIAVAFGNKLTPSGQASLVEMRRVARWGPLLGWLYWPRWDSVTAAPGFVWVEEGRVVGNASLRRATERGGFFIGNVAVHPDWQGHGIAGQLMEAALNEIDERGGRWVGLEVRTDNQIARRLYESLSFQDIGRTVQMLRPAGLPWSHNFPPHPLPRRGHRRDGARLIELVRSIVPTAHRPLLELRRKDYQPGWERTFNLWLEGRRESWWVVEEDKAICGAVRTLRERGRWPDRLEVLVAPEHDGRLESVLLQQGMVSLRESSKKVIETVLMAPTEPLVDALEKYG
ncbi:MAG: GNAT family N-acetyltransferase, partial [Chloroflexota bacterium]|nr:GNAT family N-acetyltransferase [Chloroflexota bacterium]